MGLIYSRLLIAFLIVIIGHGRWALVQRSQYLPYSKAVDNGCHRRKAGVSNLAALESCYDQVAPLGLHGMYLTILDFYPELTPYSHICERLVLTRRLHSSHQEPKGEDFHLDLPATVKNMKSDEDDLSDISIFKRLVLKVVEVIGNLQARTDDAPLRSHNGNPQSSSRPSGRSTRGRSTRGRSIGGGGGSGGRGSKRWFCVRTDAFHVSKPILTRPVFMRGWSQSPDCRAGLCVVWSSFLPRLHL